MDVEEFRNLTLSLASSIHHGDRLLLSSRRELGPTPTLLAAVERIVDRIQIQHDLGTLAWNGLDSTLDEQLLDLVGLRLDLVVTSIDGLCAQLQTIERRLRRQRFALIALQDPIPSEWIPLAGDQPMDGIKPQMVMIIEIFVAQDQPMNPLTDKLLNAVFDITRVTVVGSVAQIYAK